MAKRTAFSFDGDRISQLPVGIAAKILSCLSMKEAARTSVLSTVWRRRWLSRTALDLDVYHIFPDPEEGRKHPLSSKLPLRTPEYVQWINNVLRHRLEVTSDSDELTELRVHLQLGGCQKHVEAWISYALASKVQSLELDFLNHSNPIVAVHSKATFPPFKTVCTSLTSLRLSGLKVTIKAFESFINHLPFLERLKVCASPSWIEDLVISGCPALRHLQILQSHGLQTVTVRNTSLVSFTFMRIHDLDFEENPNLVVLRACDVSSDSLFAQIACCLPQLQILTLYAAYKSCPPLGVPKMNGLKQLTLILDPVQVETLYRLTAMLLSSPNLEKLELEFIFLSGCKEKAMAASEKRTFAKGRKKIHLPHLEVVEVRGYYGDVAEDRILEYLLDHIEAPKLKPVVFDPRGLGHDPDMTHLRCIWWREEKSEESLVKQFRKVVPDLTLLS